MIEVLNSVVCFCRSRTPDKLTPTEGVSITNVCNEALRAVIGVTKPRVILGIG